MDEEYYFNPVSNLQFKLNQAFLNKAIPEIEEFSKEYIFYNYFKKVNIHKLHNLIIWPVFDFGIHSGPKRAIKFLQIMLDLKPDGIIGPETIKESEKADYIIYNETRHLWLKTIKPYEKYRRGFENRMKKVKKQSKILRECYG